MVYGIYAIELVQTILLTVAAFRQFGTGFGNIEALNSTRLLWFAVPILSSIGVLMLSSLAFFFFLAAFVFLQANNTVQFVVQTFYAYRIKILVRSTNLVPMVVVLVKYSNS